MKSSTLSLVLLAAFILIISGGYTLSRLTRESYVIHQEKKVATILKRYKQEGLMNVGLVDNPSKGYVVPALRMDFSNGKSIGQMISEVKEVKRRQKLEQALTFKEYVRLIAENFTRGTAFEHKIQINEPPKFDHLNIYFIESDPSGLTPHFTDNCAYIGYQNAIICDASFVSRFMQDLEKINMIYNVFLLELPDSGNYRGSTVSPRSVGIVRKYMKDNFLVWILGHEIAHAILHKNIITKEKKALHFDLEYDANEKEADTFVADHVSRDSPLEVRFTILLGEFIEQEFRRICFHKVTYGDSLPDVDYITQINASENDSIKLKYDRYRVPPMLRAMRMMEVIEAKGEAFNSTASYGMFGSDVYLMHALSSTGHYHNVTSHVIVQSPPPVKKRIMAYLIGLAFGVVLVLAFLFKANKLASR